MNPTATPNPAARATSKNQFLAGRWRFALRTCLAIALTQLSMPIQAKMQIASEGTARCVIVTQPGATVAERYAADELASMLKQITGAAFEIKELKDDAPASAIIVGPGPVSAKVFPEVELSKFGNEDYAIRTKGGRLLLAGGRPRGTLYAVYRFLQEELGVR